MTLSKKNRLLNFHFIMLTDRVLSDAESSTWRGRDHKNRTFSLVAACTYHSRVHPVDADLKQFIMTSGGHGKLTLLLALLTVEKM